MNQSQKKEKIFTCFARLQNFEHLNVYIYMHGTKDIVHLDKFNICDLIHGNSSACTDTLNNIKKTRMCQDLFAVLYK